MRRRATTRCQMLLASTLVALLAGCASGPPAPDWQASASGSLDRATSAYLEGDSRVAAQEFARARSELARTGDPALVARGELTACAVQVASLEFNECPAFAPLAVDAGADLQAYARYLSASNSPADAGLLPAHHQPIAAGNASPAAVGAIADPLSRLVAAGVMLRRGAADPAIAKIAVDTASAQGWRRPLLAWLMLQHKAAEAAQDGTGAARLQRRIDLLLAPGSASR
ncbi:hypothetical protein [Piscinibacter sakaiensis]|uniref:hypothetical protein n=1 Tax=Piscinibacter sakaiensis TaxID=1547922 RepID=UPI003AADFFA0